MIRKYVFKHESSLEHYVADAFMVCCVDDRFGGVLNEFIKELGFGHVDKKSPAGGVKLFASPEKESDREYMFREMAISIKLHNVKKVMLFSHHDCGAYGGFKAFHNHAGDELKFHQSEHKKAVDILRQHFPELVVETYFIDEKGIIKTS